MRFRFVYNLFSGRVSMCCCVYWDAMGEKIRPNSHAYIQTDMSQLTGGLNSFELILVARLAKWICLHRFHLVVTKWFKQGPKTDKEGGL